MSGMMGGVKFSAHQSLLMAIGVLVEAIRHVERGDADSIKSLLAVASAQIGELESMLDKEVAHDASE